MKLNCNFISSKEVSDAGFLRIVNGKINQESYDNFLRMEREKQFFESSIQEKRSKDKAFGKMIRANKKIRKQNKF
jgi:ribosome biogenesis GTPase